MKLTPGGNIFNGIMAGMDKFGSLKKFMHNGLPRLAVLVLVPTLGDIYRCLSNYCSGMEKVYVLPLKRGHGMQVATTKSTSRDAPFSRARHFLREIFLHVITIKIRPDG